METKKERDREREVVHVSARESERMQKEENATDMMKFTTPLDPSKCKTPVRCAMHHHVSTTKETKPNPSVTAQAFARGESSG